MSLLVHHFVFKTDEEHVFLAFRDEVDVPEGMILVRDRGFVHLMENLRRVKRGEFLQEGLNLARIAQAPDTQEAKVYPRNRRDRGQLLR